MFTYDTSPGVHSSPGEPFGRLATRLSRNRVLAASAVLVVGRFRLRSGLAFGLTAVLMALSLGVMPTAANAAGETLNVTLSQVTGTGPFDADDAAGHDSSAANDVVRTNDTVTYTVGIRYEGGQQTTPTINFTLPKGEELVSLPPFCLPGSSVTPATLPAPAVPITAISWQGLPTQSVNCIVDGQTQGTALDYRFVSKVRPEVPNGTDLSPVTATATSDQVAIPAASESVYHSVSAAANFDVSKRLDSETDTSGPFFQNYSNCTFDASRSCAIMNFPLTMDGPAGGKGLSPLQSPITVTEDLRPNSFFGAGTTSSAAWAAAGAGALEKYAPRLIGCNAVSSTLGAIPGTSGGSATNDSSVRDSGTASCAQPTLGTPVDVVFTDADTTGYTVPTKSFNGSALPADSGYVLSVSMHIEVPLDAIMDLGIASGNSWTLNWENTYTDVDATAIDGTPNQGENLDNNVRAGTSKMENGYGFTKGFSGITGAAGNTPLSAQGSPGYTDYDFEGPPGSSKWHDGNTVVLPGQTVLSNVLATQSVPPNTGTQYSASSLACDTWDSTKLAMPQTFSFAGADVGRVRIPSEGSPAWVSSWNYNDGFQTSTDGLQNLRIEYGYTATPGSGADSACDTGDWASTPAGVSGATVVDGQWHGVNRVRFSFSSESAATNPTFDVNLSIALTVLPTAGPNGTILPNWASIKRVPGVTDMAGVIAASQSTDLSTYVPADNSGSLGDRLIVGEAAARIKKLVKNPTSGEFTDTAVPQYTAGSAVQYRLDPSLTADVSGSGTSAEVVVEDCLPRYQSFVSSVRGSGAAINPVLVQAGAPTGSELTCAPDETYVKWDLGSNPIGQAIDPIVYTVEISDTVRNATYTNTALVSSDGDMSPATARDDDAQIQIVVPTGIKIAKTVDKPTVEVNGQGLTNPRSFVWSIDFANIDSPADVSDVDVIDVLPANGIGDSTFSGSLQLDSANVTNGTGIEILYTAQMPGSLEVDPNGSTNQAAGSTVWCDAVSGGAVVSGDGDAADCPTAAGEVTGLRFLRAGAFEPTDEMTIAVAMTPVGNAEGDVYENSTAGRVVGVSQPVGPATREVNVFASTIGDFVWLDLNQDGIQDAGEVGVEGMPVTLTGTDVDGNAVSLSSTTGADGKYLFANLASGNYVVTFDAAWVAAHDYDFTLLNAGSDRALDSDADPTTGAAKEIALGIDEDELTIDAGLVQPVGGLIINKALTGAGTTLAGDTYAFDVVCTSRGVEVYNDKVVLTRAGDEVALASDRIGNLPIGSECVVTETENGAADSTPAPVTVTVVKNDDDNTVTVAIVNVYSAGTISASKVVDGAYAHHESVADLQFTLLVTCQVETDGPAGSVIGTVYSGPVVLTAGESKTLLDAEGDELLLPLGARCFVEETDDGGADESSVNFDSFENAAVVTDGTPDALQKLTVTATNTFSKNPDGGQDPSGPASNPAGGSGPLAHTGMAAGGIALFAGMLLAGGVIFVLVRRRKSERV